MRGLARMPLITPPEKEAFLLMGVTPTPTPPTSPPTLAPILALVACDPERMISWEIMQKSRFVF